MPTIKISGSSDDLIEISGDAHDEMYPSDTDEFIVVASDGTVLSGSYGKGDQAFWRFNRISVGTGEYSKHEATDEDEDYSDIVTLSGDSVTWVAITERVVRAK